MRILFVTSEAFPLIKTGGLADVSGSLPAALRNMGEDVRVLIPGYRPVLEKLRNPRLLLELKWLPLVGTVNLMAGEMPDTGVPVIAIACTQLFEREGGPYLDPEGREWLDNPLRFGILSRIAAILGSRASPLTHWIPDIVHFNDWQGGLTPAFMRHSGAPCAKSVLGIHNLAFQGNYAEEWVEKLGLPPAAFHIEGLEYFGQLSFLKAGVYYADSITTVSPTYAAEIQTEEFGFGMQGLLTSRARDIHGILNGIDTSEWNPAIDPHLPHPYDADHLDQKRLGKQVLQQRLGLAQDADAPMLGVVSRLTNQKGLDLLLECAAPLLAQGCQIVLLGGGEPLLEHGFWRLSLNYPQQVSVNIGYNEPLSHQIMAGADIFIMPSRFEPCGLNQMYGLRYGTPPVVRRTGGLADSICDTSEASLNDGSATGFVFDLADAPSLLACIQRAIDQYRDKASWEQIQKNGMARDLGWDHSAQAYRDVYRSLLVAE
ncbi:glycogen synthase [mine drainage metagenome]|uniref:starch synthase n=1 Tax=mine drainage metagenome TaxID=410659 RepID=A0A1J5REL5_9ZZZZ